MLDPFTMAMIGASVGALSNPKKPLKGALIGGTMGYAGGSALGGSGGLLGSSSSPLSAGGISNGAVTNALAGGDVGKGLAINGSALAGSSAAPGSTAFWQGANTAGVGNGLNVSNAMGGVPGTGAFEASMGLNKAYNAGSAAGLPGSGTIESVMGQAGADGVFRNSDYFANIMGSPVYTGNEGLLSQIGTGANSIFDTAKTELGDSITPQNLIGVSNILSNMNSMPRPVASNMGGSQITGTPPKFEPFQTGQVYTRKRGNR
jgi:hypothetical protein